MQDWVFRLGSKLISLILERFSNQYWAGVYQRVYQATLLYAGYFRSRERFSTNPCGEMASQSAVGAEKHSGVISYFLSNLEWSDKKNMYDLSYFLNAVATSIKERTLFHYFT